MPAFHSKFNIYHSVDFHNNRLETNIINHADLLLASSDKILDKYKVNEIPKYKINHGLADYFINGNYDNVSFIENKRRINVGYVGNLHYHYLDVETLKKIITSNNNVDFYFMGPYERSNLSPRIHDYEFIKFLESMINVHLLGSVPSWKLPGYLSKCDLFLMCYSGDINIGPMANPHKILEFLSTGKVVVSHYIDEYKNMRDIIEMVDTNELLPSAFQKVINNLDYYNSDYKSKKRIKYAKGNTYAKQIDKIEEIISGLPEFK